MIRDRAGHGEQPEQPTREEVSHAVGCFEEVDGVPGRRRVDHDEVVGPGGVDLVEALHRDVVVALDEASRDVGVERVLQDGVAGLGVGRVPMDEVVPRLLRVEHRRPQLAMRGDPALGERLGRHTDLDVAELLESECVGQALGRVDGEHQHLAAEVDGRLRGHRGGGRGLADTARAAADDDLASGQELLEGRRGRPGRGHQYPSSSLRNRATSWVARTPWLRWNR